MKRIMWFLFLIIVLGTMVACTKKEAIPTELPPPEPLVVELTVTESVDVGELVHMETLVTQGDENIDDADEVVFEIWEEGKKTESETMDSVNEGEGLYSAETSFDHDGTFHIQVHVTARGIHTMHVKEVIVGDGGNHVEEAVGHDYHTEGFAMHFMEPDAIEVGNEVELVVNIELDDNPLENLKVRYEIWSEGNPDKHDWEPAEETASGEYNASYTFSETDTYTVVIHVEDDEDLHEHVEYIMEITK